MIYLGLTGGPLSYRYKLVQFHLHWGHNSSCGSEHTVDGQTYAAEVGIIHGLFHNKFFWSDLRIKEDKKSRSKPTFIDKHKF